MIAWVPHFVLVTCKQSEEFILRIWISFIGVTTEVLESQLEV